MATKTIRPNFPEIFNGYNVVWGQGNDLICANLIARIPMYTLVDKEKEPERWQSLYDGFWEQEQKTYLEAKAIYDECIYVDTTWSGNTEASARITKIVITDDKQYVCWKASHEYQAKMDEMNLNRPSWMGDGKYHLKPGRYNLTNFISLIKNKQIRIIKNANPCYSNQAKS